MAGILDMEFAFPVTELFDDLDLAFKGYRSAISLGSKCPVEYLGDILAPACTLALSTGSQIC